MRLWMVGILTIGMALGAGAEGPAPISKGDTFEAYVPTRAITTGPSGHWFSYYDKEQFDPTNRYVLGMAVDFQDRTPNPEDTIRLGMVDTQEDDRWIDLGETRAWCWQQGCMLQWLPGSKSEVMYNDRQGTDFVSVILDVFSGEKRVLPKAIYSVGPKGKVAVGTNFARIDDTRPGYGYKGGIDPGAGTLAPAEDGIYAINLESGESRPLFSLAQIAAIPQESPTDGRHWFNHLLVNPAADRFIFLHRAYPEPPKKGRWATRMFTASLDGSDLHCVNDHKMVSHFIWKDPKQILAWSYEPGPDGKLQDHFHLYQDQADSVKAIGADVLKRDGHCTYSPDREWILTDSYPDRERMQHQYLYRPSDGKLVLLGKFLLPPEHKGEFRCDLHARWSRDGRHVCLDSMHMGSKRQMYLLDISGIVGAAAE